MSGYEHILLWLIYALVNDLKVLLSEGYKIIKTRVKDMFPNTPHAETVVKLIKE